MTRYKVELPDGEEFSAANYDDIYQQVLDSLYPQQSETSARARLHQDYGIHPNISKDEVIRQLEANGDVTLDRRFRPKPKYHPFRRGMYNVTFSAYRGRDSIVFSVATPEAIYESLKQRLYPVQQPSDRQFRFQLSSYLSRQVPEDASTQELVELLELAGVLTIKEIKHAAHRKPRSTERVQQSSSVPSEH